MWSVKKTETVAIGLLMRVTGWNVKKVKSHGSLFYSSEFGDPKSHWSWTCSGRVWMWKWVSFSWLFFVISFNLLILERGREGEKEEHWFVVPPIYAFVGWFSYVLWQGIEPTALVNQGDALTNWAYPAKALCHCFYSTYLYTTCVSLCYVLGLQKE